MGKVGLKVNVKQKTFNIRYAIVTKVAKTLIPNIYHEWVFPNRDVVRPMTLFAKDMYQNEPLKCAEVGVLRGDNAHSILSNLNVEKMYLIDSYSTFYRDGKEINVSKHAFNLAKQNLRDYLDKIVWLLSDSINATLYIPRHFLDFVYIDANHSYETVKADIEAYYPLVKTNRLLGGHNYEERFPGVIEAVNEFADKEKLKLYVSHPDWWIVKR